MHCAAAFVASASSASVLQGIYVHCMRWLHLLEMAHRNDDYDKLQERAAAMSLGENVAWSGMNWVLAALFKKACGSSFSSSSSSSLLSLDDMPRAVEGRPEWYKRTAMYERMR